MLSLYPRHWKDLPPTRSRKGAINLTKNTRLKIDGKQKWFGKFETSIEQEFRWRGSQAGGGTKYARRLMDMAPTAGLRHRKSLPVSQRPRNTYQCQDAEKDPSSLSLERRRKKIVDTPLARSFGSRRTYGNRSRDKEKRK